MKIIVPAYFYPGAFWKILLESNPDVVRDVIINPASGPGTQPDPAYRDVVKRCHQNGFGVLGYVATTYGAKYGRAVRDEIQRYYDWYAPTGIFLDEVSSELSEVNYYKEIGGFIRGKVVLNHGTIPHEDYFLAGDVLVIFESDASKHAAIRFPAWLKKYRNQSCQIVIGCGVKKETALRRVSDMKAALKKAASWSEYIYITDDVEPNPYDVLPSFWRQEVEECGKGIR